MTLARLQPRRRLNLTPDFDRFFDSFLRGSDEDASAPANWIPATDVLETETDLLVQIELPGMSKDDIKINLDNGVLTIQGEKKPAVEENQNRSHRSERVYGRFARSFALASEVEEDKIEAGFDSGVLTLTLPKAKASMSRVIKIA